MTEEKTEEPKEQKQKERYQVGEITTQTAPVVIDTENKNEAYTVDAALAKIMNDLEFIKKHLA